MSVSRSSRKSRSVLNVHRPRVRSHDGHEAALPTWAAAQAEDWPGRGAMNLILINVSTRKLRCAVRLPEGVIATKMGRPIEGGQNILARLKALIATTLPRTALRSIDDKSRGVNCNVGWSENGALSMPPNKPNNGRVTIVEAVAQGTTRLGNGKSILPQRPCGLAHRRKRNLYFDGERVFVVSQPKSNPIT